MMQIQRVGMLPFYGVSQSKPSKGSSFPVTGSTSKPQFASAQKTVAETVDMIEKHIRKQGLLSVNVQEEQVLEYQMTEFGSYPETVSTGRILIQAPSRNTARDVVDKMDQWTGVAKNITAKPTTATGHALISELERYFDRQGLNTAVVRYKPVEPGQTPILIVQDGSNPDDNTLTNMALEQMQNRGVQPVNSGGPYRYKGHEIQLYTSNNNRVAFAEYEVEGKTVAVELI